MNTALGQSIHQAVLAQQAQEAEQAPQPTPMNRALGQSIHQAVLAQQAQNIDALGQSIQQAVLAQQAQEAEQAAQPTPMNLALGQSTNQAVLAQQAQEAEWEAQFAVPEGGGSEFWNPDDDFSMDNVGLISTDDWRGAGNLIPQGWVGEHYVGITGQNWDDEWDSLPDPYANFVVPELSEEEQTLVETADAYFVDLEARADAAGFDDLAEYLLSLSAVLSPEDYASELSRYNYFGEAWEMYSEDYLIAKQSAMGAFYADPEFQAWLGTEDAQQWVNGISGTLGAVYGISGDQAQYLMTGGLNDLLVEQGRKLGTQEDVDAGLADYVGQVINTPDADPGVTIVRDEDAGTTTTTTETDVDGEYTEVVEYDDGSPSTTRTVDVDGNTIEPTVIAPPPPLLAADSAQGIFDASFSDEDFRSYMTDLFFGDDSINETTDWNSVSWGDKTTALGDYLNAILGFDYGGAQIAFEDDRFPDEVDAGTTPRAYPRFIVNAMENGDAYISAAVGGDMYSWWDSLSDAGQHKVMTSLFDSEGTRYAQGHEMMQMVNVPGVNGDVFRLQSSDKVISFVPNFYLTELGVSDEDYIALETAEERAVYALSAWLSEGAEGRVTLWDYNASNGGPVGLSAVYVQAPGGLLEPSPGGSGDPTEGSGDPPVVSEDPPVVSEDPPEDPADPTYNTYGNIDPESGGISTLFPTQGDDDWWSVAEHTSLEDLYAIVESGYNHIHTEKNSPGMYDDFENFDWIYYLNSNPDFAAAMEAGHSGNIDSELEAIRHYVLHGAHEGRPGHYPGSPGPDGWPTGPAYRPGGSTNPTEGSEDPTEDPEDGVIGISGPVPVDYGLIPFPEPPKTGASPHYDNISWEDLEYEVDLNPDLFSDLDRFDWEYYLERYPDLVSDGGINDERSAIAHYIKNGASEGRMGSEPVAVVEEEPTGGDGIIGVQDPSPEDPFAEDSLDYGDGTSREAPFDAGETWGMWENPHFNPAPSQIEQVQQGWGLPFYENSLLEASELSPYVGWNNQGEAASWPLGTPAPDRATMPFTPGFVYPDDADKFDWVYYVNSNPDLATAPRKNGTIAAIDNESEAWQHWFIHGHSEGRAGHYEGPETPDVLDQYGYVTVNGERLTDEYGPVTSSEMYYEPGRLPGDSSEGDDGYIGIDDRLVGLGRWRNRVEGFGGLHPTPTPEDVALAEEDLLRFENLGELASGGLVGQNFQSFAPVGIASGYGGGGYVAGYSGGMDDSIPAVTDGNSPAALSSGEFVVPADVVAHLGDGNTQNGSAKLMDMLGRIRQQKTGNPVQPDAIQDQWVMPA
tara:strand:- start:1217 stop:5122 length:3906 start_codon:yes stop_codon:yes gene_type:complete